MKKSKCLILAPRGYITATVERVLAALGVDANWPIAAYPDWSPSSITTKEIATGADFVVGILAEPYSNADVLFGLGIASAFEKPLFLLFDSAGSVPEALRKAPSVSGTGIQDEALDLHLRLFLGNLESVKNSLYETRYRTSESTAPLNKAIKASSEAPLFDSALEREVYDLFSRSGMNVRASAGATSHETGYTPDLVVWPSGSTSDIGDPIVVEIISTTNAPSIQRKAATISSYLAHTNIATAIIVTNDVNRVSGVANLAPLVFVLSRTTLAEMLGSGAFLERLRSIRNQAAHSSQGRFA